MSRGALQGAAERFGALVPLFPVEWAIYRFRVALRDAGSRHQAESMRDGETRSVCSEPAPADALLQLESERLFKPAVIDWNLTPDWPEGTKRHLFHAPMYLQPQCRTTHVNNPESSAGLQHSLQEGLAVTGKFVQVTHTFGGDQIELCSSCTVRGEK